MSQDAFSNLASKFGHYNEIETLVHLASMPLMPEKFCSYVYELNFFIPISIGWSNIQILFQK